LIGVSADAGYKGTFVKFVEDFGLKVEISERITPHWEILPKRWRVERTLAWLNNHRRLSKDYEISTWSAESQVYIAFAAVLLKRLF
jgi:transposase